MSPKSSHISSKHQFEQISTSGTLSADLDSIWASVLVWEGGSMVKRITQNSPTRCSLTPCQLFSSIRPSIVPSFTPFFSRLPVCGYLCPFSSFQPCQEDYMVLLPHFSTHPPFSLFNRFASFHTLKPHLAVISPKPSIKSSLGVVHCL